MKNKIHHFFGFSISSDSTSYHVRVRVPSVQRALFMNHLPRRFVSLSTGPLYSELFQHDTMRFCFSLKTLNPLLPVGTPPEVFLYNYFLDILHGSMMDYVCPSVY